MTKHYFPEGLTLNLHLRQKNIEDVIRQALDALPASGYAPLDKWSLPDQRDKYISGSKETFLGEYLAQYESTQSASFYLEDGTLIGVYKETDGSYAFDVAITIGSQLSDQLPCYLSMCEQVTRCWLKTGDLVDARLRREAGGAEFLPGLPIVGSRTYLIVTDKGSIAEAYEDVDAFMNSGWDTVEQHGDRYLFMRAMQATDSVAFASAVQKQQWRLARAARAGLTDYYMPVVNPEEVTVYKDAGNELEPIGYLPDEKLVEYSGYYEAGEHVPGWQIYALDEMVWEKKLPNGDDVERVRVVFYDQSMAEREKRPLLDIGVKVYYLGESEALIEVAE